MREESVVCINAPRLLALARWQIELCLPLAPVKGFCAFPVGIIRVITVQHAFNRVFGVLLAFCSNICACDNSRLPRRQMAQ